MFVNNSLNVSSSQTRNCVDDTATRQRLTATRRHLLGRLLRGLRAVAAPERCDADFQRFVGQYGPFTQYLFWQRDRNGSVARR